MKFKHLRFSLLSMLVMLCGGLTIAAFRTASIATYPATATWDFKADANPRAVALLQGSNGQGTLDSDIEGIVLTIDATNGKFDSQNRTGDAQVNNGTIIQIPVFSTKDVITLVGNYSVTYDIGTETGITDLNKTYTATAADVEAGYVTVTAKATSYFYSISVVLNDPETEEGDNSEEPTIIYSWEKGNPYTEVGGIAAGSGASDSGDDVSNNYIRLKGKNDYTSNIVTITLDNEVKAGDKINVTAYRNKNEAGKASGFKAKFEKGGEVSSSTGFEFVNIHSAVASTDEYAAEANTVTFDVPEAAAGSKTITMTRSHTSTNLFIDKLTITRQEAGDTPDDEPITGDVTANWDWQNQIPASITTTNIQGTDATGTVASDVEGIELSVLAAVAGTNIKLAYNTSGYAQFNQNTAIRVPVKNKGDEVTVISYPGQSNYTVGGEDATGSNTFVHEATATEATQGYVEVIATEGKTSYLYSIKVVQKAPSAGPVLVEKSIYKTDFSEWSAVSASTTETVVEKTTKFTNEPLNFTLYNTAVMSTEDSKFANYTTLPHMALQAQKANDPYVTTSPLANITKVRFIHAATGNNRGWKLEAKGDGDADWVVISSDYANPASWCEVTKEINKTNVQLRWTNLTNNQNAYMFELEIFGNVDLSGAPLLGSFKANGKLVVADEIFEMGNDNNYHADIELFKDETMISESNPITEITADNGEIGTITYATEDDKCVVTIPVTAEGKTVNYIANFIRKPLFTLTYLGPDGQQVGTQQVEKDAAIGSFQYDIASVAATKEGYKARGWFKQNYVGEKYATNSIITEDCNLYAVETEIEGPSDSKKYVFDLTDKNFDPADHEAFNSVGNGKYHNNHGWTFGNGDKIELLVGKKASITMTLCTYSAENITIDASNGKSISAKVATDGGMESIEYEGEEGTLTLTFNGTTYIHSITILNTTTTNYNVDGDWYFVFKGDVSSLIAAIDAVNGAAGTNRKFIYLPNGTYDLGTTVLTQIGRSNVSLIGESMESVIIKNAPPVSMEGLNTAATLWNSGNDFYMQDLTLQNDLDYYGAGAAGRANAYRESGNHTVAKNVRLLSYQDTYLTPCDNQLYWEDSEIHGTVDYICGGGDVFFERVKLVNESRKKNEKNGEDVITAHQPKNDEKFGYVFNNCTIENLASKFSFSRAWGGAANATVRPTVTYLNTVLNQPTEIISTRFTLTAMNNQSGVFHEYNSMDTEQNVVSPQSNSQTFTNKTGEDALTYETILSATEAANYSLDKVFPDWQPAAIAAQLEAPEADYADGTVKWTPANNGAIAYLIEKNGEFAGITTGNSMAITIDAENDKLTIRAANSRGGFGPAKQVTCTATSIQAINAAMERGEQVIYNLAGQRVNKASKGMYIINGKKVAVK